MKNQEMLKILRNVSQYNYESEKNSSPLAYKRAAMIFTVRIMDHVMTQQGSYDNEYLDNFMLGILDTLTYLTIEHDEEVVIEVLPAEDYEWVITEAKPPEFVDVAENVVKSVINDDPLTALKFFVEMCKIRGFRLSAATTMIAAKSILKRLSVDGVITEGNHLKAIGIIAEAGKDVFCKDFPFGISKHVIDQLEGRSNVIIH